MYVLGVDISYLSTGLAVLEIGPKKEKVIHTEIFKNEGEELCELYQKFYYKLTDICKDHPIGEFVIEDLNIQYMKVAKKILPLHGITKLAAKMFTTIEATAYNVSRYRFTILKIKRFNKEERVAVAELGLNQAQTKSALHIKRKVTQYVNKRLKTNYSYDDNDVVDAIALCLAYKDELYGIA